MPSRAASIVKPTDCVFCFSLPLNQGRFVSDIRSSRHEFARLYASTWQRYRHEIVAPFEDIRSRWCALGALIVEDVTLARLSATVRQPGTVFVIAAHWNEAGVELADGFTPVDSIVQAFPDGWDAILDLCVCHPERLALAFKASFHHSVTRYTQHPTALRLWLDFYTVFLHTLHEHEITYFEAVRRTYDLLTDARGGDDDD